MVSRIDAIVTLLNKQHPPLGTDLIALNIELSSLHSKAVTMQVTLDEMEGITKPPLMGLEDFDMFTGNESYIPLEDAALPPESAPVWPDDNYKHFAKKAAALIPPFTSKVPLESLLMEMEQPTNLKILLPCPLEIYTTNELFVSKNSNEVSMWHNQYADPLEPFKCWTKDVFATVYSRLGYHFLFACVTHLGPQSGDSKLPALWNKLSQRWGVSVTFTTIQPHQDWMLYTVPSSDSLVPDGLAKEIIDTSLMRLVDGHTSYIVHHISPASQIRDLEFTVCNSSSNADATFQQLKK